MHATHALPTPPLPHALRYPPPRPLPHPSSPIHSVCSAHDKKRTNRSIFNNIIPHTTGASKTVDWLFPQLKGKIKGTSIRVPINNVSMVDLNLHFNEPIEKEVQWHRLLLSLPTMPTPRPRHARATFTEPLPPHSTDPPHPTSPYSTPPFPPCRLSSTR